MRPELPSRVVIREVGPRDGLQSEQPLSVEQRVRFLDAVSKTGVSKIEAVSFVSPKAVPAMADAAQVWARAEKAPGVAYSTLVPNRRGAEAAAEAGGFASLQAFLGAADGYNRKNVGKSVRESVEDVRDVVDVGAQIGVPVEVSISAAFGDPYEGDLAPQRVVEVARMVVDAGAVGVSLGDTTGMGTPARVWEVLDALRAWRADLPINLHFHDTRGTAMANTLAALQAGVTEFDASVGGIGGSPFAPGAGGNLATEDVGHMLHDMNIETGIDLGSVLDAARALEGLLGRPVSSHVSRAGPRGPADG